MNAKVYYRRPKYTAPVAGHKSYGRDGDGRYATECSADPDFGDSHPVGYALADTMEEARKVAYGRLVRQLEV